MKRITFLLFIGLLSAGVLRAEDPGLYLRRVHMLKIPYAFSGPAALHAGVTGVTSGLIQAQAAAGIPFGGAYRFTGGIGAGRDPLFGEMLSDVFLGLDTRGAFPGDSTLFWVIGASAEDRRAESFRNRAVCLHLFLQKAWPRIRIAAGAEVSLQHHRVEDNPLTASLDERVYVLMPRIAFYSPWGDVHISALRNAVSAGIAWTLQLGEQ